MAGLLAERPDEPALLDAAVWTVCATDGGMFRRPTQPLSELLAGAGLACEGDWVAGSGFDFPGWRLARRIEATKTRYELTDDEALAVLAAVRLYEQTLETVETIMAAQEGDERGPVDIAAQLAPRLAATPTAGLVGQRSSDGKTVRAALGFLAEPAVAAAVLTETDSNGHDHAAVALGAFAESAEPLAPRAARPALRWLRAKAHERLGDFRQAEKDLQGGESLDPTWPLTLVSLAGYASDRGDAERGLALLRGPGHHPMTTWWCCWSISGRPRVRVWAETSAAGVGRVANTRCATSTANSCRWNSGPPGSTRKPGRACLKARSGNCCSTPHKPGHATGTSRCALAGIRGWPGR